MLVADYRSAIVTFQDDYLSIYFGILSWVYWKHTLTLLLLTASSRSCHMAADLGWPGGPGGCPTEHMAGGTSSFPWAAPPASVHSPRTQRTSWTPTERVSTHFILRHIIDLHVGNVWTVLFAHLPDHSAAIAKPTDPVKPPQVASTMTKIAGVCQRRPFISPLH